MKTEMKAVVASIVVIALALSAVSGIAYSWFSDTETSTIEVTTANMSLTTSLDKVTISSSGFSAKEVPSNGEFVDTETSSAKYNSSTKPTSMDMSLTWKNVAVGDLLNIYVLDGSISTTIPGWYMETIKVTDSSGHDVTDSAPFTVTGNESKQYFDRAGGTIAGHMIAIQATDISANTSYSISLTFEVVQYAAFPDTAAVIDGTTYADVSDAIDNAVDGDTIWISSGNYTLSERFVSKSLVINGNYDGTSELTWSSECGAGSTPSDSIVINNVTLNILKQAYQEYFDTNNLTMNNCIINGMFTVYSPVATFNNCIFNSPDSSTECIWSSNYADPSKTTFKNCTFNGGKYAINVYTEEEDLSMTRHLIIDGCSFNNTTGSDRAAVVFKTGHVNWDVTIKNTIFNSFNTVDKDSNGYALYNDGDIWAIKDEGTIHTTVTINGVLVYTHP